MNAYEYILSRQTQWAKNRGIDLGSKGSRGRRAYTPGLDANLFEPLEPDVRERFLLGDGSEITGYAGSPAKMQAVHSSSALGINVFQYWKKIKRVPLITTACGFCPDDDSSSQGIVFEDKYPINHKFRFSPNIDVVFHNADISRCSRFAIECKFSESYGARRHSGLKPEYMSLMELWQDIGGTYELAKSISPGDGTFTFLHAAQLIKHILGLKAGFGKDGFRLLYLWYDVPGEEGATHRKEIETFSRVVTADGLNFHAMTYQELIVRLSDRCGQEHRAYVAYLAERYL
jgi:hypothetical protein